MAKLEAIKVMKRAWNGLKAVIRVNKDIVKRKGGKLIKRKKSFGKHLKVILNLKQSNLGGAARIVEEGRGRSRRSGIPIAKRMIISRRKFMPTAAASVVSRLLPHCGAAADNSRLVYITDLLKDDVLQFQHQLPPMEGEVEECKPREEDESMAVDLTSPNSTSPSSSSSAAATTVDKEEEEGGIDKAAEAFIANFRQQIKLQRQRSFSEYHERLARSVS